MSHLRTTKLNDRAWNKAMFQEILNETAVAIAYRFPIDESDTCNFCLEKFDDSNKPPIPHLFLFDFSSKNGSLRFPIASEPIDRHESPVHKNNTESGAFILLSPLKLTAHYSSVKDGKTKYCEEYSNPPFNKVSKIFWPF